jgi:hypothetical protein
MVSTHQVIWFENGKFMQTWVNPNTLELTKLTK